MHGTNTTDPCACDAACLALPAEFVRLRYFFGQRLGVVDLADEQSYLVGKQRFHNMRLHGAGVLCGLDAERYVFPQGADPAKPTTLLRVSRGAALDACGREIVVGWDQCIDVAAWYAQHPNAHPALPAPPGLTLWVTLCYRECPSDLAPAPRDPCGCDAGGCEFARIREGFQLKLITDEEAKLLAEANQSRRGAGVIVDEEVLDGPIEDAFARIVARLAGENCADPPADPCLLASFQATLDGTGQKVVDISPPDNTVPERLSLLSTSMLQHGLLRVLAAASDAEELGPGPSLGAVRFAGAGADSGTLTVEINIDGLELARDPLATTPPLTVKIHHFKDADGTWEPASAFTQAYVAGPPPRRLEFTFADGLLDGGRYRLLIENDRAQPVVDTHMRPLTPPSWARHFRLLKGGDSKLALASSLY